MNKLLGGILVGISALSFANDSAVSGINGYFDTPEYKSECAVACQLTPFQVKTRIEALGYKVLTKTTKVNPVKLDMSSCRWDIQINKNKKIYTLVYSAKESSVVTQTLTNKFKSRMLIVSNEWYNCNNNLSSMNYDD